MLTVELGDGIAVMVPWVPKDREADLDMPGTDPQSCCCFQLTMQ